MPYVIGGIVGVILVALVVGAAAWDRSHGRKDEQWEETPAWIYPVAALGFVAMLIASVADRNWWGLGFTVCLGVLMVRHWQARRRT